MNGGSFDQSGGRSLGTRIELASGEVVTWEDLLVRGYTDWQEDMEGRLYTSVDDVGQPEKAIGWERQLLVPGRLYPQIVLRESAVAGAAGLALLLAAVGVVGRRRPG
jgi:hypothetical protein